MATLWLDEIGSGDIELVGGKAASLGELVAADLPVPPAFVVTAGTYREFIRDAGIEAALFEAIDVDTEDSAALAEGAEEASGMILEADFPAELAEEILADYEELGGGPVAVRSSATAEDLPDASFAGQQETFLNVTGDDLLDRVKECWASLFTERAIYYRHEQGFDHADVNIAVVVQRMVEAEKAGVLFTSHPSTGDETAIVEAAWGLGEAVVSGSVSPDNYVIDRTTDEIETVTIASKKLMFVRDEETGETVEREVPADKRDARVLTDDELWALLELGDLVEAHFDGPQDVEWALADGEIYMLQSRPITTIEAPAEPATSVADGGGLEGELSAGAEAGDVVLSGLGASPGRASGPARIVEKLDELDKVTDGDILVTGMTTPDMVPGMKRSAGIVTNEGGMTSHAAIVSRELGVPAIVGTGNATEVLVDGQAITIDGERGTITAGAEVVDEPEPTAEPVGTGRAAPITATEVKVNVSIPEAAGRAAATGADGVGLLRLEHMTLGLGKTPAKFIADHGARAYVDELVEGIRTVADEFYPKAVTVRTLDAPTDEYRSLEGGDDEPHEHNPMLGYRGIRRSLDEPEVFTHELEAFARLYEMGYDNVELMLALVNDATDVERSLELMREAGLDPDEITWGVMVETPASALGIDELAGTGIDFISLGTNDLTQYTLAVDRNNENVADRFDELHPAVLELIGITIRSCREHGIETSICGEAASVPEMVEFLVGEGITSISANIDAVGAVRERVKRTEQQLLLDSVR